MHWSIDVRTQQAARNFPLPIQANTIPQDAGGNFNPRNWQNRLRAGDVFAQPPPGLHSNAPSQIVAEFQNEHYVPALALTVSWGGMGRTGDRIYGNRNLQTIHRTLDQCAESIRRTQSIQQAWQLLTGNLQWSGVMASKTLHFLSRALGFNQDPPVPIDGLVHRNRVWWAFRGSIIPFGQRPDDWDGDTFEAYCRYMTAILTWAELREWTTTEIEATIYGQYR